MNIAIQRSDERGSADYSWLHTKYSFSFAEYYNPKKIGFGNLLVLNEDRIAGKKGFGMHHHDNMEIITIVLSGSIEHKDSEGNHGVIKAGELQRISAGSGVFHSEFNAEEKELHLLQLWIKTKKKNITPSYEQKNIPLKKNTFTTLVSNTDKKALHINQDATIARGIFEKGAKKTYTPKQKRVYVFVINGALTIGKETLMQGDAAEITNAESIICSAIKKSDILIITT